MVDQAETAGASEPRAPALELIGISKRFAGVQALADVRLKVYPGEVLALIGENGAGKSTMMKIVGGVHQPDEGEIRIAGQTVQIRNVADSNKYGVSFIHQELNTLDNLDIASNVYLGREPLSFKPFKIIDQRKMYADARPYLEQVGLSIPTDTPLRRLSIAQQQLVEIAKALSLNARILIMDEPTSSLTLSETERLLKIVRRLRDNGVAIIYISHRLDEVKQIADRVTVLRDGKNAGEIPGDQISHDLMVRMMVGRDIERFTAPPPGAANQVRLSVKDIVTRRYPAERVSFDICAGEILGFAGLVGAGRTETAQAIYGVEPAISGEVRIDGNPAAIRSARDAIRSGIYLAPEDRKRHGVIVDMPIQFNITLPALDRYSTAGLVNGDREYDAAVAASRSLSVKAPSTEFLVRNLSGGNQQKVVLAKWFSLGPKVLIFDEPTRGIDVGAKAEIYDLMRRLAHDGVAIMMISSDMEEVLNLSDRIAVMHEGKITGFLTREQANEEAVMELAVSHRPAAPGEGQK